ncbi:M23 family metallopeptidase [Eubacteriales bacterium OttesenSCG-928-K08]|nr:M23 family metallopeptidase [Eubacteriales bacterium OttesenSCG-928-K08]
MKRTVLFLLLLFLLLSGCMFNATPVITDTPAPEPIATPSPAPTPEPTEEEIISAVEQAFLKHYEDELELYAGGSYESAHELAMSVKLFVALQNELKQSGERAYAKALLDCGGLSGGIMFELPTWKLLASLLYRLSGNEAKAALINNCALTTTITQEGVFTTVTMSGLDTITSALPREAAYGVRLSLYYLNTIYDEAGEEIPYEKYVFEEGYLSTLTDPLPKARIKDGWYNSRDKGVRKHTGTDIRSPEDTPILSCSDGEVTFIGSNEGAGNYVVVRDDYGFEYHYYHMVRLTDFISVGDRVSLGDVVGNVGNTGNSDANHLHLGVVSPAYTYINPYDVLKEVRILLKQAA